MNHVFLYQSDHEKTKKKFEKKVFFVVFFVPADHFLGPGGCCDASQYD